MAMEDAIVLARELASHPDDVGAAFVRYQDERRAKVARIQTAAGPSLYWWEHFADYYDAFEPWQFAFHFFSRSIPLEKIRERDADFAATTEERWAQRHGSDPLRTPLTIGDVTFADRALAWDREAQVLRHPTTGVEVQVSDGTVVDAGATDAQSVEIPRGSSFALVSGGTDVARVAIAETIELAFKVPAIVVAPESDPETLVLSGRASAIVDDGAA